MLLTIRNLSADPILAHTPSTSSKFNIRRSSSASLNDEFLLQPSIDFTTLLPKGHSRELIIRAARSGTSTPDSNSATDLVEKEWRIHPGSFKIRFSLALAPSWQVVDVPKGCPWWVFTSRITRKHHHLLILNRRNLGSFLSELPDRLPLSSIVLPGTHDTMAFHGWPISQCQSPSTPLSSQLLGGIRILDIRLAVIPPPLPGSTALTNDQQLIAYHGLWPQKTPFLSVLYDIETFLASSIGSKETIVMSIKQEDFAVTPAPLFSQLVHQTIIGGPGGWIAQADSEDLKTHADRGMWFLENRIPTLGEVRGKVVMFSRFGGNGAGWDDGLEGLGIHPTTWPDSEKNGFEWELKGTLVMTHDWYSIPSFFSIPEKVYLGTVNLIPPKDVGRPILPITYFSAASFPLAFPPTVAKGFGWPKWGLGVEGVNSLFGKWLVDQLSGSQDPDNNQLGSVNGNEKRAADVDPRIRGWTFLDYYSQPEDGALVPLLVECNFRGRKKGEEGW